MTNEHDVSGFPLRRKFTKECKSLSIGLVCRDLTGDLFVSPMLEGWVSFLGKTDVHRAF